MDNVGVKGVGTKGSFSVSKEDTSLSKKHLQDSLEFNIRHAEDHLKIAKETCERMRQAGIESYIPRTFTDLANYFDAKKEAATRNIDKDAVLKSKIKEMYNG